MYWKLGINSGHKCNCILLWFFIIYLPKGRRGRVTQRWDSGWHLGRFSNFEGIYILYRHDLWFYYISPQWFYIYSAVGLGGWHLGRFFEFWSYIYIYCIGMIYDFIIYTLFLRIGLSISIYIGSTISLPHWLGLFLPIHFVFCIGLSRSISTSLDVCFDYRTRHVPSAGVHFLGPLNGVTILIAFFFISEYILTMDDIFIPSRVFPRRLSIH